MFRARAFGPFVLAVLLCVAYAPTASALAIFEAFGLAGIEVEGDVVVTFEDPEPNGPILFAPLALGPGEADSDAVASLTLGSPDNPGFLNFDFDALLPAGLDASAFAWVTGAAQGPAASASSSALAFGEVFLINNSDVAVNVAVTIYRIAAAFADLDDPATESSFSEGAASIFEGESVSSADGEGPVQMEVSTSMALTAFEILAGGFASFDLVAVAEGEALSDQVIPEPTTALLLGLGLLGLGTRRSPIV